MKKTFIWLLLALAPCARADNRFVYENAFEFQTGGDFDGDGRSDLLIVDKVTGDYRVGYQLSVGAYTWVAPRASGIANATGLGVGPLNTLSYDSLALTGPDANRINILDANNSGVPGLPVSVFIPSLGPNLSAVIDIGGPTNTPLDDLYVASIYNGAPAFRQTLIRNGGGTNQTPLVDAPILYQQERGNAVLLHTNRGPRLGVLERNVSANLDYFSIYDLATGAAVNVASVALSRAPQPAEYVTGQFNTNSPYTDFLFYPPTGSYFLDYQVTEPSSGVYALVFTNSFTFTNVVDRLFVLPGTNGDRIFVLYTNDTSAAVYNYDGRHAPTVVQQFTAAAGQHFTGAGALGNGSFIAYSAPLGQNTSAKFAQWKWNGSSYSNNASGNLPPVSGYTSSGNVMQFKFEPFVTNNPVLLRLNSAGDWSRAPLISGGNISVVEETFLGTSQGLGNPSSITVGPAHPQAAFGLANQYSNVISLFSFTPPAGDKISDVTISPPPGIYQTSIQLQFTAATATDKIFFRVGTGPWVNWSGGMVVNVFTNTVVQYYGQPGAGNPKSAIKSAAYSFTAGPSTLDSNHDGIPDYVKIALGLNLTGSRDTDGDGYSDLEELIHGTDPNNPASVPTGFPHLDDQAVFDVSETLVSLDGTTDAVTSGATNSALHAYDLQGGVLTTAVVAANTWPAGVLTNISIVVEDRLIVAATDLHYDIVTANTDKTIGREMLGLVGVPAPVFPTVPYVYGGGNLLTEAANWVASASNTFNNLPRTVLSRTLSMNSTLEAVLFEREIAGLLAVRDNTWSNVTLFPFRPADAGRTNPPQAVLLALESATTNQPGHKLQTAFGVISNLVENSSGAGITSLRAVVQDIYRIDSLLNNANPAKFASPVDETRFFLANGSLDSNYLAFATTAAQFSGASAAAAAVLAAVPPRPTTNVALVVRSDTLTGPCRILDLSGGVTTFALVDSNGVAFTFPDNFQLLAGSVVQITGYTDAADSDCAFPAIEVTSAGLSSVPVVTDTDANGNLLIDSWERRFFGGVGLVDPFGDADGDGYSNLQEMLDGSDPRDRYDVPTGPAVAFAPPVLDLQENGVQGELHFHWPAAYISDFNFSVLHTPAIDQAFTSLVTTGPINVSGDEFKLTFALPGTATHFYLLTVSLR